MKKLIHGFNEGNASMKNLLGGKGANLAEMVSLGIPVPPGYTITTEACNEYHAAVDQDGVIMELLNESEDYTDKLALHFGYLPLVSIRSGARVSMPGMMDTILNVGLTSETLPAWKERIGAWAALDSYRRLIQMFGTVVEELNPEIFESAMTHLKKQAKVDTDQELSVQNLEELVNRFLNLFEANANYTFPDTFDEQLGLGIRAVFNSWNNERAKHYRKMHGYSDDWGTAVNIQAMVFGNMNDASCSGVLFTRNPSTGSKEMLGEYLINAQGEDVVAGVRTPDPISQMADWHPHCYHQLIEVATRLELHYADMQDIEFTVQDGKLYLLQTRNAKRTNLAAVIVAHDLEAEDVITLSQARSRITTKQFFGLTVPTVDEGAPAPHGIGLPAGGHVVRGVAAFTAERAVELAKQGPVILIAKETTPDDIKGMEAAVGILTQTGGATSHAAVVARGMNTTCVVGMTSLHQHDDTWYIEGWKITEGTEVTIDGMTGNLWVVVDVPMTSGTLPKQALTLLGNPDTSTICLSADGALTHKVEVVAALGSDWLTLAYDLKSQGHSVVFNLTTPCEIYSPEDMLMYSAFGSYDKFDWINRQVEQLTACESDWNGCALYSNLEITVDPASVLEVVKRPKTVADVMNSEDPMILTGDFIKRVMGGKAATNKLLKLTGQQDLVMTGAIAKHELLDSLLG